MAESQGVWGIDIGQVGLKALRLKYAEAAGQVIAVAFDYVPHAKILSQPDAVPEELIPQALETFLSRNDVQGDLIAISVPGQTALARFIKLPPVEASKLTEIVKYEARQQIPFALEDVIWDYQTVSGGVEESGYMLETEVGLFAMKRDQVMAHLRPFLEVNAEVELVQIAPLALYNFLSYDRLGVRPGRDLPESDEYVIALDMGADATTLLVTNGTKIWIRNVPIGGNHFTRALTKEMKLTFAKAEHLKCNATKSPDPRAVFQALRPVFNEFVSEIQRSIGYFSSVNRDAKIKRVLGVGNGFKLAGLQKFLQQHLQYEVERVSRFESLIGDSVLNAPLFQENLLSFAVPYGLAVQGLGLTRIHTTLLPQEIATARKIRKKKPMAVAAAAALLLGLATSSMLYGRVLTSVSPDRWERAEKAADQLAQKVGSDQSAYTQEKSRNAEITDRSDRLVGDLDTRVYWPELYRAINAALPRDLSDAVDDPDPSKRRMIRLHSITFKKYADLGEWYSKLREDQKLLMTDADRETPPEGAGYVCRLRGTHYYSGGDEKVSGGVPVRDVIFVRQTLLKNLQQWQVQPPGRPSPVPVRQIGITHPTILDYNTETIALRQGDRDSLPQPARTLKTDGRTTTGVGGADIDYGRLGPLGVNPLGLGGTPADDGAMPADGGSYPGFLGGSTNARALQPADIKEVEQTTFVLEFVWKPTPKAERAEAPPSAGDGTSTPDGS